MSLRTTMTTSEKAIQKSMTRPRRSVHHTSFLWALCHELMRSTTQRFPICSRAGLPFSEMQNSAFLSMIKHHVRLTHRFEPYMSNLLMTPRVRYTRYGYDLPSTIAADASRIYRLLRNITRTTQGKGCRRTGA